MLSRVEIRRLTWPLQNISLFYLQKLLGCFCCMFWVIVHLYYEVPPNQLCCIWLNLADSISLYTSEFFWLHLSSVTSSLNKSNPVPLEAMHANAITLHHVSRMMLYALDHELFPSLLHTFFLLSFWYRSLPYVFTNALFFIRMYQNVDLATPNVPAISLIDLFCF